MKMKQQLARLTALALLVGALAWLAPQPISAQASLSQTVLAANVSATTSTITVASAGSIAAGWVLYVDTEAMRVTSISGTTVQVQRAWASTRPTAHLKGAVLYAGPATYFASVPVTGACTASAQVALPRVNTTDGSISNCVGGVWRTVNLNPMAYMTLPRVDPGTVGEYAAKLTDVMIAYTSLTGYATVTLPSASGLDGHAIIVKDESGQISVKSFWITINPPSGYTIDGGSSTSIRADYGTLRLYSNGTRWFSW